MFFVLSTGRAGSRTVATTLSQSPNCLCLHEPTPTLLTEGVAYRYGSFEGGRLRRLFENSRTEEVEGKVYGEAANRLSVVVPVLREAFPRAKYVWLMRDGRNFVCSAIQRGWHDLDAPDYPRSIWDETRVRGDRVGDMTEAAWQALGQFGRVCWLWTYTNRLIARDIADLGDDRKQSVQIEQFANAVDALAEFLDVERAEWVVGRSNARQPRGETGTSERAVNIVDRLLTWSDWGAVQRERFELLCGPLMDVLYSEWRGDDGQWREVDASPRPNTGAPRDSGPMARTDGVVMSHGEMLEAIRTDVAELKVIRGELSAALRHHGRVVNGYERRNEELRQAQRELQAELERRTKDLWATQERLGKAKEALGEAKDTESLLQRQVRQAEARERDVRASRSYRLGNALVRGLKVPIDGRVREDVAGMFRGRLKRNPLVRKLAGRTPAVASLGRAAGGKKGLPVPPGNQLDLEEADSLLVAMIVLLGATGEELEQCVDDAAAAQLIAPVFKPLFVIDCDDFTTLRRHGFMFEYVPPRQEWAVLDDGGGGWSAFLARRLRRIVESYRPATIVTVQERSRHGPQETGSLAALLQAVGDGSLRP